MSFFQIDEITDMKGLESLRGEWEELWKRSDKTPFQSPGWLVSWWRHFGGEGLWAITLRRGGELKGVAPLFIHRGPGGIRRVYFIGTGISDYLDFVVDKEVEQEAVDAVFSHIKENSSRWDICDMQELRSDATVLRCRSKEFSYCLYEHEVCPVISLPAGIRDLYAGLLLPGPYGVRRNRHQKKAERAGAVRIERADGENNGDLMETLFLLHSRRWTSRGGAGVLSGEAFKAFHREVAGKFFSLGILRLYRLMYGETPAASLYSFFWKGRAYIYLSGLDPEFLGISPGKWIMGHAIEEAMEEGIAEFDLLRGGESYKYMWGAQDKRNRRLMIAHKGFQDLFAGLNGG